MVNDVLDGFPRFQRKNSGKVRHFPLFFPLLSITAVTLRKRLEIKA
jgi:hypothetical protein